jgi:hypothetical protein
MEAVEVVEIVLPGGGLVWAGALARFDGRSG